MDTNCNLTDSYDGSEKDSYKENDVMVFQKTIPDLLKVDKYLTK